jgi:hypothetical protein
MPSVIGIDPGGTIGVGVVHEHLPLTHSYAWTDTDPVETWNKIVHLHTKLEVRGGIVVVIEDYVGAGFRDKDSIHTLKQVGFFTHACAWLGIETEVVQPGARKRSIAWAADHLGKDSLWEKKKAELPHATDGLAHAKSGFLRRKENATHP